MGGTRSENKTIVKFKIAEERQLILESKSSLYMANITQLALNAMYIAQEEVTQISICDLEEYPCNYSIRKALFFLDILREIV